MLVTYSLTDLLTLSLLDSLHIQVESVFRKTKNQGIQRTYRLLFMLFYRVRYVTLNALSTVGVKQIYCILVLRKRDTFT